MITQPFLRGFMTSQTTADGRKKDKLLWKIKSEELLIKTKYLVFKKLLRQLKTMS